MAVVNQAQIEAEEQRVLEKFSFNGPLLLAFEELLGNVFGTLRPKPSEYEQRRQLIDRFKKMTKDMFGGSHRFATMEVFGSFVMDIFTTDSDLDLSLNLSNDSIADYPRAKKITALRKLTKSFYVLQARRQVSGIELVMGARVPVLKVVDGGTGVECDISVENKDGIKRSSILSIISSLDERFRILSYLMKAWAKAHHINSARDHTMNSLTIICLVSFHLQTRDTPILPPFSTLFKDGTDSSSIQNAFLRYRCSSGTNEETVSRLFVSLLSKLYSAKSFWQNGLCASTYDGRWISKTLGKEQASMKVEDFLDRSQNLARAVNKAGMLKINKCIKETVNHISCFMKGQSQVSMLNNLLFGSLPLSIPTDPSVPKEEQLDRKRRSELRAPVDPMNTKRPRFTEGDRVWPQANNQFHTPIITHHPSFPPAQPGYQGRHLGSSSVPSQERYVLHHPQPPFAPHMDELPFAHSGYMSLERQEPEYPSYHSGHESRHRERLEFPFTPHLGYPSAHNRQPEIPFHPHSGNGIAHLRQPEDHYAPRPGYGLPHHRPPVFPSQYHYGWHHEQLARDQMFR